MSQTMLTSKYESPSSEEAVRHLESARLKSAAAFEAVVETLAERSIDTTLSTKQLLELGDYFYKTSGAASKQLAAAQTAPVKVTFNFNTSPKGGSVTIEQQPQVVDDDPVLPERDPARPMLFVVETAEEILEPAGE